MATTAAGQTMLIETERLRLRPLRDDDADAAAMLELLNEPGFHRYIGDRGIRTLEQARGCIRDGPLVSYARHGYGMRWRRPGRCWAMRAIRWGWARCARS